MNTLESNDLETLRREIDKIDDTLLELIGRRVEIVQHVAAAKKNNHSTVAMRPGREAQLLRRLIDQDKEMMSAAVVSRIWREMISALCRMQAPMTVAVTAPERSVGYWDMARSHYGSATPMTLHRSPHVVLGMIAERDDVIGVLPWPSADDEPWWMQLVSGGDRVPQIIARLPFVEDNTGRFENLAAMAVGHVPPEPSGDDVTLLAVAVREEVSRAKLNGMLETAGITGHCIDSRGVDGQRDEWLNLVEVPEYLAADDPRLGKLKEQDEDALTRIVVLGAYALPIKAAPTS